MSHRIRCGANFISRCRCKIGMSEANVMGWAPALFLMLVVLAAGYLFAAPREGPE